VHKITNLQNLDFDLQDFQKIANLKKKMKLSFHFLVCSLALLFLVFGGEFMEPVQGKVVRPLGYGSLGSRSFMTNGGSFVRRGGYSSFGYGGGNGYRGTG
jgi:hypothetical protein